MVRSQRRATPRGRNSRSARTAIQAIRRSLNFEPRRASLSADPPILQRTFNYNTIIPFTCIIGSSSGVIPVPPSTSSLTGPLIVFAISPDQTSLIGVLVKDKDLYDSWLSYTGFTETGSSFTAEICVQRLCFWGSAHNQLREVEVGLWYDQTTPASTLSVQDVGTPTRRAHCSLSTANKLWVSSTSVTPRFRVDPDVASTAVKLAGSVDNLKTIYGLGRVHVTLGVRRTYTV